MKGCDPNLIGLYLALIQDCRDKYPRSSKDWDRDSSRLLSLQDTRGDAFFTLDLPVLGKHLDRCVAEGRLSLSMLPGSRPYRKGVLIPRLFRVLWTRIFCEDGLLRQDVDIAALRLLRQLLFAGKKYRRECSDSRIRKTVQEYFDVEHGLEQPTLRWDSDELRSLEDQPPLHFAGEAVPPSDQLSLDFGETHRRRDVKPLFGVLHYVCDTLVGGFEEIDYSSLRPRHGPGAVADLPKGGSKYAFPNWPRKLEALFPASEYAVANYGVFLDQESAAYAGSFVNHEPPSKLIAVPKTQKGPRIIASEPIAHQWIQQGLLRYLTRSTDRSALRHCLSFRDQTHNGRLALHASHTGSHATIDLSAASDRVSCWLVERVFRSRPDILDAFHACRTRWIKNTIHRHFPTYLVCKKFAAMGSALTFPVQSIVFSAMAIASVIHARQWSLTRGSIDRAAREVRVFGDDIIVPADATEGMIQVLTDLGLKVNPDKTFRTGKFRESCGVDAYDGVDVTPAYYLQPYIEADQASLASLVECANNFLRKGLVNASTFLARTIPAGLRSKLAQVSWESGAFGLVSIVPGLPKQTRYNRNLHRLEAKVLVLVTSAKRKVTEGYYHLLQYFTEAPEPDFDWMSGTMGKAKPIARHRWVALDTLS